MHGSRHFLSIRAWPMIWRAALCSLVAAFLVGLGGLLCLHRLGRREVRVTKLRGPPNQVPPPVVGAGHNPVAVEEIPLPVCFYCCIFIESEKHGSELHVACE